MRRAIAALPQRQRTIVMAHYFGEKPLRALVAPLNVSPQRVSQLHLLALRQLHAELAATVDDDGKRMKDAAAPGPALDANALAIAPLAVRRRTSRTSTPSCTRRYRAIIRRGSATSCRCRRARAPSSPRCGRSWSAR